MRKAPAIVMTGASFRHFIGVDDGIRTHGPQDHNREQGITDRPVRQVNTGQGRFPGYETQRLAKARREPPLPSRSHSRTRRS